MNHFRIFSGICDAFSLSIRWSSMPLLITLVLSCWSLWIRFCLPLSLAMFFLRGAAFFCCGLLALPFLPPCTILSMLRLIKQAITKTAATVPKWHKIKTRGFFFFDFERMRRHGVKQEPIYNFFRYRVEQAHIMSMMEFIYHMVDQPRFTKLLVDYQPKIMETLKEVDQTILFNYKYLLHYGNKNKTVFRQIISALVRELTTRQLNPQQLSYLIEDIFQWRADDAERLSASYLENCRDIRHEQMPTLNAIYSDDHVLSQRILDFRNRMAIARYSKAPIDQESLTASYQKIFEMIEEGDWARLKEINRKEYSIRIFLLPLDQGYLIRERILVKLVKLYERLLFDCLTLGQTALKPHDQNLAIMYLHQNLVPKDYKQFEHILHEIHRFMPQHSMELILLADKLKYTSVHMARHLLQLDFENVRDTYQAGAILKLIDQPTLDALFGEKVALVESEGFRVRIQNSLRQLQHRLPGVYAEFFRMYKVCENQIEGVDLNTVKVQSFLSVLVYIKSDTISCPRLKQVTTQYSSLALAYLQTINLTLLSPSIPATIMMSCPQNKFMTQLRLAVKPGVTVNYREKGFLMHFVRGEKQGCFIVGAGEEIEGQCGKGVGAINKLALQFWKEAGWEVVVVKESQGGPLPSQFFTN